MLRLKQLLQEQGYTNEELRKEIVLSNGEIPSKATITNLLNGIFPKTTPMNDIKTQVAKFLNDRGISERGIWGKVGEDVRNYTSPRTSGRTSNRVLDEYMLGQATRQHFNVENDLFTRPKSPPFFTAAHYFIYQAMLETAEISGLTVVVGESGSGKSTLFKYLLKHLADEGTYKVICLKGIHRAGKIDDGHITRAIIASLLNGAVDKKGKPIKVARDLTEQSEQMFSLLVQEQAKGNRVLLVLDEGHDHESVLNALKTLNELEHNDERLMGVLVIAQSELKQHLRKVSDDSAIKRFALRAGVYELEPLATFAGDGNSELVSNDIYDYLCFKLGKEKVEEIFVSSETEDVFDALAFRLAGYAKNSCYPLHLHRYIIKLMNNTVELGLEKITPALVAEVMP